MRAAGKNREGFEGIGTTQASDLEVFDTRVSLTFERASPTVSPSVMSSSRRTGVLTNASPKT